MSLTKPSASRRTVLLTDELNKNSSEHKQHTVCVQPPSKDGFKFKKKELSLQTASQQQLNSKGCGNPQQFSKNTMRGIQYRKPPC